MPSPLLRRLAGERAGTPDKDAVEQAKKDLEEGKSPSTAAGEFVRREVEHIRQGKHGARSPQQAVAIGLSEARSAGIPLKPPRSRRVKERARRSAERAYEVGQKKRKPRSPSRRRSEAVENALEREPFQSGVHPTGLDQSGLRNTRYRARSAG